MVDCEICFVGLCWELQGWTRKSYTLACLALPRCASLRPCVSVLRSLGLDFKADAEIFNVCCSKNLLTVSYFPDAAIYHFYQLFFFWNSNSYSAEKCKTRNLSGFWDTFLSSVWMPITCYALCYVSQNRNSICVNNIAHSFSQKPCIQLVFSQWGNTYFLICYDSCATWK